MLQNILELVKDQVMPAINKADVPEEKKQQAVDTTASTILSGLKDQLVPDNLSELMNLFGKGSSSSSLGSNVMVQTIQSSVVSALTQKVGLSSGVATTIAGVVVPAVVKMLGNKVQDDSDSGFSMESLVKSLSGSDSGNDGKGGLAGMLGSLFGK